MYILSAGHIVLALHMAVTRFSFATEPRVFQPCHCIAKNLSPAMEIIGYPSVFPRTCSMCILGLCLCQRYRLSHTCTLSV